MTEKYKNASKYVDEIRQESMMPTEVDILGYIDYQTARDKERWLRKYIEAIRVEKTGREIHHRKFFLKSEYF